MYRYTTPSIICTLKGVDFSIVSFVRIAVKGESEPIVREIPISEIDPDTGIVKVELTQEETASLDADNGMVTIQARIKYTDGTVQATNMVQNTLWDVLDKVVI